MSDQAWQTEFRRVYDAGVAAWKAGRKNPATMFHEAEAAFLATIGCTRQELFDFVDDAQRYGEPDFATALEVAGLRRDYFLTVLKGRSTGRLATMESLPPKDKAVDGIARLPRIIVKARLKLRGEMPADLMYGCGGDRDFLRRMHMTLPQFLELVWRLGDDDRAIVNEVKKFHAAEKRERIDQILSRFGHCSRSEARAWLAKERVCINGVAATSPNDRAFPREVLIDGQPIESPDGLLALLHKPDGYACSHDPREAPTVYELIPGRWLKRNPAVTTIGRLDRNTTGVLLFTDDGQLVQQWTSPRHKFPKLYEVAVDTELPSGLAEVFASGKFRLQGEDKPCLPARLEILGPRQARLELVEGRFHQVKRMFAAHGCHVLQLHRSQFGPYDVSQLQPGQWRVLDFPAS